MKVIFLDVDGVLNCKRTANPRKLPYVVDRRLLARFKRLLDRTGAKVVLSSTWRYDPAGLFSAKHWGIPFIGTTPDMPKRPRRDEIRAWLKKHPKVTRFAVIDDEDDELDELPLFQPSAAVGLTDKIVRGVVKYLDGTTDDDMRRGPVERLLQNVQSALKGHQG
jgi:HAD domain in Swiss Army Knife RNA repair proteins